MRVFAIIPVVAAVTSTHEKIESMKATLRSVAEGEINQDTKRAIQGFMNTMNSTLRGALVNEAADHQAIIDAIRASVEGCKTARNNEWIGTGAVVTAEGAKDQARIDHMQCKTCYDSCLGATTLVQQWPTGHNYGYNVSRNWGQEDENYQWEAADYSADAAFHVSQVARANCGQDYFGEQGAWWIQDQECTKLDNQAKQTLGPDSKDTPNFCGDHAQTDEPTKPGTDNKGIQTRKYYSWEAEEEDTGLDVVYSWFSQMDNFESNHRQVYKDNRFECHDRRNVHMHKAKACHRLQADFEGKYCAWSNAIDTTCYVYEGCYRSNYHSWLTQKNITQAVEDQLKLQQQALECALCYGNQILQDKTDLTVCDSVTTCDGCGDLNITYPVPHEFVTCTEKQSIKPCGDDWKNQEYYCLAETNWPPKDCMACSPADEPTWPANATEYIIPVSESL